MPPKPYKFRFQQKMSRVFALNHRTNTPAFHRHHPALLEMIDQSDFMSNRHGTFISSEELPQQIHQRVDRSNDSENIGHLI